MGCTAAYDPSALHLLPEAFEVHVPQVVADELRTLGSYDHPHLDAANAAEDVRNDVQVVTQSEIADSVPPLDAGERAAIELANAHDAAYLFCDEFTNLALIASGLEATELLTTPALLAAFVDRGVLPKADARDQLADIADRRSWENNSYYQCAKRTLDQLE